GGGTAQALRFGTLAVEFQEPGEDLVAEVVGPAVTPRLLAAAPAAATGLVLVLLVVEEEVAGRWQVAPAVGVEHGAVHRSVQFAELEDVGRTLVGIVEAVVGLGQTLVVADHQLGAEFVVGL